jgi:hypothetical protein
MRKSLYSFLIALACQLLVASVALSASIQLRCSDTPVSFSFDRPENVRCLCSSTEKAIGFLRSIGLHTSGQVRIKLVRHISHARYHSLFGSYEPAIQQVMILDYAEAAQRSEGKQKIMGIDLTEDLWCSFAAHELAHVISKPYLNAGVTTHTAAEYIAFVTQFTVLSPETREMILSAYHDVHAYNSLEEMSETYYLLDPNRFAVKSYLHFSTLQKPGDFIRRLLQHKNGH